MIAEGLKLQRSRLGAVLQKMKNRPLHQRTLDVAEGILHPREQGYRWKPLQSCLAACSLWYTTVSTASSSRVISRYSPGKRISSISFATCTASIPLPNRLWRKERKNISVGSKPSLATTIFPSSGPKKT